MSSRMRIGEVAAPFREGLLVAEALSRPGEEEWELIAVAVHAGSACYTFKAS
jgi:hypothetical protein